MPAINESVRNFLDALTGGLGATWVPRRAEPPRADLVWWSCGVSVDPACRFLAGASAAKWEELGTFDVIAQLMQRAIEDRFGAEAFCTEMGVSEEPPYGWTAVSLKFDEERAAGPPMELALNPDLMAALGGDEATTELQKSIGTNPNPAGMLMDVEIPVTVSLGRTRILMKDLLGLTNGSVVALDQELNDDVEIRVNNCVIARGEVVAVDGNYGVRILKMVSGQK